MDLTSMSNNVFECQIKFWRSHFSAVGFFVAVFGFAFFAGFFVVAFLVAGFVFAMIFLLLPL